MEQIIWIIFLIAGLSFIYRYLSRNYDFSSPDGRIRKIYPQRTNQTNRYYQSNGYHQSNGHGYHRNAMFHSNDDNQYSHAQYHDEDSSRNYDGVNGTGDYIMNGSYDEQLDFSNPNHYPIIDSYDNNINEDNPTNPW